MKGCASGCIRGCAVNNTCICPFIHTENILGSNVGGEDDDGVAEVDHVAFRVRQSAIVHQLQEWDRCDCD